MGTAVMLAAFAAAPLFAQDSVDVTFRCVNPAASGVSLPGEFNGWDNTAWPMTNAGGGTWVRTARLRLGGNPAPPAAGIPGAWQYKFFPAGTTGTWPNDSLNHHQNPNDNNNSFLYIKDPTLYQILPNQRHALVATSTPTISAYIFPKVGTTVDTGTIMITIDGESITGLGSFFDSSSQLLVYPVAAPLPNGGHTVILTAGTAAGGLNADTVTFQTESGYVRITTHGGYATRNPLRMIRGVVQDTAVHRVLIVRNGGDTTGVAAIAGIFSLVDTLREGVNTFVALADSGGALASSDTATFQYVVDHAPTARATAILNGANVSLSAATSSDPDLQILTFKWFDDPDGPLGLSGATSPTATVAKPAAPGEYPYGLIATDPDGNADTTRSYFIINPDGSLDNPSYEQNPAWARRARIYFLFPKAASAAGTLNAAAQRLPSIRDLGFNVVWLMPVMKNASPINNGTGPGYNIVDFYHVADEYGTDQDFKNFVAQAHSLGLKVILDVTPNHSSRFHPWSSDAHVYKQDSQYWSWYEHGTITANTNGLGDCLDADGFNYYCGFSDQLLNFNWSDVDMRTEMINVYAYWIKNFDIDGYRFDVYWGPDRRYGEQFMGQPVRQALKHVKASIMLLGEDDATGVGTETIFADHVNGGIRGGLDAAYDFNLYHAGIETFDFTPGAITNLQNALANSGFYPGPHALFMRFMESQDEDRIVWFYSNSFSLDAPTTFLRTMPMASVLFTAPGIPMLWNGQEVGWGYGLGSLDARRRSVIDWNYQGKDLLSPHYQKLASIRGQFPAFTQHKQDTDGDGAITASDVSDFVRIPGSNSIMYAFTRPYPDQNGLTVVNFSPDEQTTTLDLSAPADLQFSGGLKQGAAYYVNDLYAGTYRTATGASLDSLNVTLPGYGTSVFTVSTTMDTLAALHPLLGVEDTKPVPRQFGLDQNFPNPFNPSTTIGYRLPEAAFVSLSVFDLLGRRVATLVDGEQQAGAYAVRFDGSALATGVYFTRLVAGSRVAHKKMLLIR